MMPELMEQHVRYQMFTKNAEGEEQRMIAGDDIINNDVDLNPDIPAFVRDQIPEDLTA